MATVNTRSRSPESTADGRVSEEPPSSPVRTEIKLKLHHHTNTANSSRLGTPSPSKNHDDHTDGDTATHTPGDMASNRPTAGTPAATSAPKKRKEVSKAEASIAAGQRVRHLKKEDGEPLWRKDIQFEFLKAIFEDETVCFTNSYQPEEIGKQTFAKVYIDAMARSSKTSKILRDKLLTEHEPAKNMAMVCLLVNIGRMNTTLNFFPEMRAQLRTYHAIPSLQARQDPNSYKQLQDAPRLKSILKGASEDRPEPTELDLFKRLEVPRTNPVNLIFVLAQEAPRITALHFPPDCDFYDLVMNTRLSSATRAKAFLWLMWHYLESDFTEEGASENPFGAGVDYGRNLANQGIPRLVELTAAEEAMENVDTPEELEFGDSKKVERKRIIDADMAAFQAEAGPPKRGPKPKINLLSDDATGHDTPGTGKYKPKLDDIGGSPSVLLGRIRPKYESDMDSTRSTPPPRMLGARSRLQNSQLADGSEGAPTNRRSRPLTAHQVAVEKNRALRVDSILSRDLRKQHRRSLKARTKEGPFFRAAMRNEQIVDPFADSDDEETRKKPPAPFREHGYGALMQLTDEEDDFGEQSASYAAAFRRIGRRLDRWDANSDPNVGEIGTNRVSQNKLPQLNGDANGTTAHDESEDELPPLPKPKSRRNGTSTKRQKTKAIINSEADEDKDSEVNGVAFDGDADKALMEMAGDETEQEDSVAAMEID